MRRGWLFWLLVIVVLWVAFSQLTALADLAYDFGGIQEFKDKYNPHWSPRYLVYPNAASLPAALIALVRAGWGDDFAREYLKELLEMRRARRARRKTTVHAAASE